MENKMDKKEILKMVDHTLLDPAATWGRSGRFWMMP